MGICSSTDTKASLICRQHNHVDLIVYSPNPMQQLQQLGNILLLQLSNLLDPYNHNISPILSIAEG